MPNIHHLFHIASSQDQVHDAISSVRGLSNWWTTETSGDTKTDAVITFLFGTAWTVQMKVIESSKDKVVWECIKGADDWIGTRIVFQFDENDNKTRVRFSHNGFQNEDDFFAMCSFSWGRYMESLRQYCQTGVGQAFGSKTYVT